MACNFCSKLCFLRLCWFSAEEVYGQHQQQAAACDEERQVHARLQDCPQDHQELQV
jgi:hypothetical protein